MRKRLPSSLYNLTSLFGLSLALLMLALIVILIIVDAYRGFRNPYMGLITYIGLPSIMLFGFFLALVGAIRTRRRWRKDATARAYPVFDLNNPRMRGFATLFGAGGAVLILLSGFGTYQAYGYTESNKFCGETCHTIMNPEYVAFDHSPHAELECKQCHIGPGAGNYVDAKLNGVHQLIGAVTGDYNKPIPTPVANLLDSKETCEKCHWTGQTYSPKMLNRTYFLADENNTAHQISMLVKVGSIEPGKGEGIHAHMYLDSEVTYIATDPQRQVIPYVEMKHKDGTVTVYQDPENPLDPKVIATAKRVKVNCTDCHNRPAHKFPHPDTTLNEAFGKGLLDRSLPEFKTIARDSMEKYYKTQKEALEGIQKDILKFYEESYADVYKTKLEKIMESVVQVQEIYKRTYFPEMRATWRAHPDNLDHMHSDGCFRCHDGTKKSPEGKVISKDCSTCHLFVAQGPPGGKLPTDIRGQEFIHPQDIGDAWKDTPCKDCHGAMEEWPKDGEEPEKEEEGDEEKEAGP